jgi:hypothetical protein
MKDRVGDSGSNSDNAEFTRRFAAEHRRMRIKNANRDDLYGGNVRVSGDKIVRQIIIDYTVIYGVDDAFFEQR